VIFLSHDLKIKKKIMATVLARSSQIFLDLAGIHHQIKKMVVGGCNSHQWRHHNRWQA
jgi:hypothetical protein